jgi:DNA polymerase III subunit delta'
VSVTHDPWASVVGQDEAVARLKAAVERPTHAYLFVGPPGSGRRAAARAFAGELFAAGLAPDAAERHRRLAAAEQHPDLTVVQRTGASIQVGDPHHPEEGSARWVVQRASLSPVDAALSVWVLLDFHLVLNAAPVLLKTIEEPPSHAVLVVVADEVTPELVTIASRCVRVDFHAVGRDDIVAALVADGADPAAAEAAALGALGSVDRARLLVSDERFGLRRDAWAAVPDQLDGTGATAARLAAELAAMVDDAQAPLVARQQTELDELAARVAVTGERGSGRRELEARHKRQIRRLRTDEFRYGFTVVAERYREQLVASGSARSAVGAIGALTAASEALDRNPNESLLLQALLVRLGRLVR